MTGPGLSADQVKGNGHDKQTHEEKERIAYHRVVIFGERAEITEEYLRKGFQVYIKDNCNPANGRIIVVSNAGRLR